MILGWREAFRVPDMPFFYVELCTEYGAEEPKENDFWLAQRAATKLPQVGFAVTTDLQRALHPPDKQDVADRLVLEIRRIAYGESIVSRGPELLSAESDGNTVVFTFSEQSLTSHAGLFVGNDDKCAKAAGHDSVVTDPLNSRHALNYTISGAKMMVSCESPSGLVRVNADYATCFLYGSSGLPAPPIQQPCSLSPAPTPTPTPTPPGPTPGPPPVGPCIQPNILHDSHKDGNTLLDGNSRSVANSTACQELCSETDGCVCFSHRKSLGHCWLMSQCQQAENNDLYDSGTAVCFTVI